MTRALMMSSIERLCSSVSTGAALVACLKSRVASSSELSGRCRLVTWLGVGLGLGLGLGLGFRLGSGSGLWLELGLWLGSAVVVRTAGW